MKKALTLTLTLFLAFPISATSKEKSSINVRNAITVAAVVLALAGSKQAKTAMAAIAAPYCSEKAYENWQKNNLIKATVWGFASLVFINGFLALSLAPNKS